MIKQLILENWKSFRHAVLDIDPLTVMIGTNASGKSNAIEALEFLKRTAEGRDFKTALAGDLMLPGIRGSIEWAALKPATQFTLKVLVQGENDRTDYIYSITVKTKQYVQLLTESLVVITKNKDGEILEEYFLFKTDLPEISKNYIDTIFADENFSEQIVFSRSNSILGQLRTRSLSKKINLNLNSREIIEINKGIYFLGQALCSVFVLDPIPSKMRFYSPLYNSLQSDASNIAGVLATLPDEQKIEIESTIINYMKHLPERDIQRVWAEPVGRLQSDAMLYCEEIWKPGEAMLIDARGMSDGTLRFIGIITALLTRPEGSQLIIEDVDNGLHPSRSDLLVKMLREIGKQRKIDILITTHNPALLDALGPEIVPFVVVAHRDNETGESKLTLLEDMQNFSKLFASASLGKLTTNGAIERSLSRTN